MDPAPAAGIVAVDRGAESPTLVRSTMSSTALT
jgi:hypothetical protein